MCEDYGGPSRLWSAIWARDRPGIIRKLAALPHMALVFATLYRGGSVCHLASAFLTSREPVSVQTVSLLDTESKPVMVSDVAAAAAPRHPGLARVHKWRGGAA